MSWLLQPHNYGQAGTRNLYNFGYRRTATYKGFGGLGQAADVQEGGTYTPPDPTAGMTPGAQQAVSDLFNLYYSGAPSAPAGGAPATGLMGSLPTLLMVGGGLLVMALLIHGGHR